MRFRKQNGRNFNNLTVASGLFDRDGHVIKVKEQRVALHMTDATLEDIRQGGITLKTSFDVVPGSYVVRLVLRDSEGQMMSAINSTVEVP